jgi:hypothetical protein
MGKNSLCNDFEMYVPYHVNPELLFGLSLKNEIGEIFNSRELIDMLAKSDYQFDFSSSSGAIDILLKDKTIKFTEHENRDSLYILQKFLTVLKESCDYNKALHASWYYFDKCYIREDPADGHFYHFYIFYGHDLILSDINLFSPPENFLLKQNDVYYSNDRIIRLAEGRVNFKKWIEESVTGKIFLEKNKIELDQSVVDSQYPIIEYLQKISKEVTIARWMLFGIFALLIYIVLTK